MKKELKSGILSADKPADWRPTVGWVNVIAVLVLILDFWITFLAHVKYQFKIIFELIFKILVVLFTTFRMQKDANAYLYVGVLEQGDVQIGGVRRADTRCCNAAFTTSTICYECTIDQSQLIVTLF